MIFTWGKKRPYMLSQHKIFFTWRLTFREMFREKLFIKQSWGRGGSFNISSWSESMLYLVMYVLRHVQCAIQFCIINKQHKSYICACFFLRGKHDARAHVPDGRACSLSLPMMYWGLDACRINITYNSSTYLNIRVTVQYRKCRTW